MDALAAELARKRSALSAPRAPAAGMVAMTGDGRRVFVRGAATASMPAPVPAPAPVRAEVPATAAATSSRKLASASAGSVHPVVARLRALGQPVALFGEDAVARRARLLRLDGDFADPSDDALVLGGTAAVVEAPAAVAVAQPPPPALAAGSKRPREAEHEALPDGAAGGAAGDVSSSDDEAKPLVARAPLSHKDATAHVPTAAGGGDAHLFLYHFWRGALAEWGAELERRPAAVMATALGRAETASHAQSREHLRPFLQLCRARVLPADVRDLCVEVSKHMLDREYMRAGDAYLRLAVGKGQWVIGVAQVGIHDRAARERIRASTRRARSWRTAFISCETITFTHSCPPPPSALQTPARSPTL